MGNVTLPRNFYYKIIVLAFRLFSLQVAENTLTLEAISRDVDVCDNENIFAHELVTDDENLADENCSGDESNQTEPASDNDDEL